VVALHRPPIEPGIDVVSLQVTPPTKQLPVGLSSQFIALAIMSDDSVIDVTNSPSIAWTSSNKNIAVIDGSGTTVALETGKTSITASIKNTKGQSIVGTAALTVTPAIVTALQVTPASDNVPKGLSIGFTATVFLSDGQALNVTENKEIIWSSSNEEIARVASNGIATGLTPGVVKITASGTANNQSFSGTVLVNPNWTLLLENSQTLQVTDRY